MLTPDLGVTDLLVPLHKGMLEKPMWDTFLHRLRTVTGADFSTLLLRPQNSSPTLQINSMAGTVPTELDVLFNSKYGHGRLQTTDMREGRIYSLDELLEIGGELGRTFLADILDPLEIGHMRSMRLRDPGGIDAWLTISGHDPFGPAIGNLFAALAPHLRVAIEILMTLESERTRSEINAGALTRMEFGWITVDVRGRIVDLDQRADDMLKQSPILSRGPYDRLTPSSPSVDRRLTDLLREFALDERSRPRAINLCTDPWIDVLVAPIHVDTVSNSNKAIAVIYLRGDRRSTADRCEQLLDVFDLTPKEAKLAWSMAQGMSIAETASHHGITVETARYYSKKIYAKTGARGQVDLVRHIQTSVLSLA